MYSYYAASVYKQTSVVTSGLYSLLLPLKPYLTRMQICQVRHLSVTPKLCSPALRDWLTTSSFSLPRGLVLRRAVRCAAAVLHRGLPRKRGTGRRDSILTDLRDPADCAVCCLLPQVLHDEGTGKEGRIIINYILSSLHLASGSLRCPNDIRSYNSNST